jgi:hypothetical protein
MITRTVCWAILISKPIRAVHLRKRFREPFSEYSVETLADAIRGRRHSC